MKDLISVEQLGQWIDSMAAMINAGDDPMSEEQLRFDQTPELVPALIHQLSSMDAALLETQQAYFSALIFALDVCVSQLRFAGENGNRRAVHLMSDLMNLLTDAILQGSQGLNFWLPVLNAFYDAQVELSPALQEAYLTLSEEESEAFLDENIDHRESIRALIAELSDLSTFELAGHFFAQSHAMPPEFFGDLMMDLCSIDEGQDAALLALLHPRAEVRKVVIMALDALLPSMTLSSVSLSRLQAIQAWVPDVLREQIAYWIREQRKKGVVFRQETPAILTKIQASEIDGGGAQGLFLQLKQGRATRLAGVLLKDGFGLKDSWITPEITATEAKHYCREVLDDGVTLRKVDLEYITMMINHFLALTLEQGNMPNLHFLEFQEEMGLHFLPKPLDVPQLLEQLAVQIEPFTPSVVDDAFKRSSQWLHSKPFAASWYLENEGIDKWVNRCCSFEDGVKICRFEDAMKAVFEHELEQARETWVFHFLWVALWLRAGARKNEKMWQDSFLIAHAIHSGTLLSEIPIMERICHQSVVNSIETMCDRRTHLSQE
ncbi:MAG: hypothetical protein P1U36_06480 [Legionellaceae bacterium]|nr:hypothetical protein [Legionellaceae bacterium]